MSLLKIILMLLIPMTVLACSQKDDCCRLRDPVKNLKRFNDDLFKAIRDRYIDKPDIPNDSLKLTDEQLHLKKETPYFCVTCTARRDGGDPNL